MTTLAAPTSHLAVLWLRMCGNLLPVAGLHLLGQPLGVDSQQLGPVAQLRRGKQLC